jgi:ribosomal protection tetracycline resistance protein
LGIVAHVDAGKTTLTERLLFAAGVIDELGSVDKGTTQTDSLALEQQRGITIKSAVVSFEIDDVTVNLIDTPGHPDFIAEVERVLSVLDGAVLVVSAVEGVQSQTRILMRALGRLRIPAIVFVNKVDRPGADCERVYAGIADRLGVATVPLTRVANEGTRAARVTMRSEPLLGVDVLAEHDDALLASYVNDHKDLSARRVRDALVAQANQGLVHPVFCGSAMTGAGVDVLRHGLVELLPTSGADVDAPPGGSVFKIERAPNGEKVAYLRMFTGSVRTRDRLRVGREGEAKVTGIAVFDRGAADRQSEVRAGQIAKVWGLRDARIGDSVGDASTHVVQREFPPPTLQSVVAPVDPADAQGLRVALEQLTEQDPLINVQQDDARREISLSLYGEVQKEVVQATLASDYGIDVRFSQTTPIYVERPAATGEALEVLHAESNPFNATIGLRIEPALAGSGYEFRSDVDPRDVPLYVYKTLDGFTAHMTAYVRDALRFGLFGWEVTDCLVTLTRCNYSLADGPPSRRGPTSTAADFRKLTPLVLRQALGEAGTLVCEPTVRAMLEIPTATIGSVLPVVTKLGGTVEPPVPHGQLSTVETVLPVTRADELQRQLAELTGGEGVLDSAFAGYQPVSVEPPPVSPRSR